MYRNVLQWTPNGASTLASASLVFILITYKSMRSETPITWYQVEGDPALDLRPQFILTADETTDLLDSHVASTS